MTEWERLQQGLIYNDFDEDLFERRVVNSEKTLRLKMMCISILVA